MVGALLPSNNPKASLRGQIETATLRLGPWGRETSSVPSLPVRTKPLWWQIQGLSYTASGYGSRIPTSRQVLYGNRWRRIYCTIYSNSGTCWIVVNGVRHVVTDY